ncbi:MAG: DUF6252 family protein [Bacteroidales bacterium]|nr:DUF6252 family protein [Bacteroidales bacterium]
MKKITISCLLLFVLLLSFGCKKDDPITTKPGLSVKIDGTTWTGQVNIGIYDAQENLTIITGANTALTEQLQLVFIGNSAGTYNFTTNDMVSFGAFAYMTNVDMYTTIAATTPIGQIVVSEYDKTNHTLSGTFHFDAYNFEDQKKVFTDGVFTKVAYTEQ